VTPGTRQARLLPQGNRLVARPLADDGDRDAIAFPVAQIMRVQTGPRWAIGARSASTSKSAVSRRFVSRSDVAAGGATAVR
jgi:hypothetical protein